MCTRKTIRIYLNTTLCCGGGLGGMNKSADSIVDRSVMIYRIHITYNFFLVIFQYYLYLKFILSAINT